MAQPYCFVCDTAVAAEICPTCNTATWHPTGGSTTPRPDEHLEDITTHQAPSLDGAPPLQPPVVSPPSGADLPGGVDPDRPIRRQAAPGRWAPIAAVVVGGIVFLSVLTGPSGLEPEDETIETPSITAQTTTTVTAPGSSRDVWRPPAGTWVGGFGFSAARPDTLFGPSMAAGLLDLAGGIIVDSLPDGRLVGVYESNGPVVLLGTAESGQTAEIAPLPRPGPDSTPPLLSPNGTRLALIDTAGVPYVWEIDGGSDPESDPALGLLSPRDSDVTDVEAIASLTWSPDSTLLALNAFRGGYYLWDLKTNEVSRDSMPGRAVAVSNTQVAAWGNNGLELRDPTGKVLRRWPDLVPGEVVPLAAEGAFDPLNRFLAVRGLVATEGGGQEGLTVLSTIGTTRRMLTTDPAQGFAWSGDGSGLYWLDSDGLQVWSADPERASASMLGGAGELFARLRVYDPAISPITHPALVTSSLVELHNGAVTRRTMNGSEAFFTGNEQATITPADVAGRFLSVASGGPIQAVVLTDPLNPNSTRVLGDLTALQLGDEGRIRRAVALIPGRGEELTSNQLEATRWYLETDEGSILFGPDSGLFISAADGSSLSFLGGTGFYVTPDGSAIQTLPTAAGTDTLLTAADLDAQRILAVGVIRRAVFVLAVSSAGDVQIWQVPADSELLATPLFPPAAGHYLVGLGRLHRPRSCCWCDDPGRTGYREGRSFRRSHRPPGRTGHGRHGSSPGSRVRMWHQRRGCLRPVRDFRQPAGLLAGRQLAACRKRR